MLVRVGNPWRHVVWRSGRRNVCGKGRQALALNASVFGVLLVAVRGIDLRRASDGGSLSLMDLPCFHFYYGMGHGLRGIPLLKLRSAPFLRYAEGVLVCIAVLIAAPLNG